MNVDNNGFLIDIFFLKFFGMCCLKVVDGEGVVEFVFEVQYMNSWEMVYGGVIMMMFDVVMVMVGCLVDVYGCGVVIIEMKMVFMQFGCGMFKVSVCCVYQFIIMVFCEGEVCDVDDKLVVCSLGMFKFVKCMLLLCMFELGVDG